MKKLKELRKKYGLSQKAFGKLFGIDNRSVSYYELGKREMPVKRAKEIGRFFKMDWWELYEE